MGLCSAGTYRPQASLHADRPSRFEEAAGEEAQLALPPPPPRPPQEQQQQVVKHPAEALAPAPEPEVLLPHPPAPLRTDASPSPLQHQAVYRRGSVMCTCMVALVHWHAERSHN